MENKITIEFAHICENVIVAKNGNLSIINIFNQIGAKSFPAVHPIFYIVVGVTGDKGEHDVKVQIKKEGAEKSIVDQTLPDKIIIPESPGQGRLYIKFSPIILESEGNHDAVITILGQTKKLFFEVKQIQDKN